MPRPLLRPGSNSRTYLDQDRDLSNHYLPYQKPFQAVACGDSEIVIAGGQENMSLSGHVLPKSRDGRKMGPWELVDTMVVDGLWCAFNNYHMGTTAENIATQYEFTREAQDQFSAASQQKTEAAQNSGLFGDEITAVTIPQRRGDDIVFNTHAIRDVFRIVTSRQVDYAGNFSRSKLPLYSYSHLGSCEDPILRCIPMLGPRSPYASGGAYFLSARAVDAYLDVYSSIPDHLIYEDGVMGECLNLSSISKDIVVQTFPPDEYRKAFYWENE